MCESILSCAGSNGRNSPKRVRSVATSGPQCLFSARRSTRGHREGGVDFDIVIAKILPEVCAIYSLQGQWAQYIIDRIANVALCLFGRILHDGSVNIGRKYEWLE